MGRTDFSDQFRKVIIRYKRIGYDLNVMRQSACLKINPIFAALFNCTPVDPASNSMMAPTLLYSFKLVGTRALPTVAWSTGAKLMVFFCFKFPMVFFGRPRIFICHTTRCIC